MKSMTELEGKLAIITLNDKELGAIDHPCLVKRAPTQSGQCLHVKINGTDQWISPMSISFHGLRAADDRAADIIDDTVAYSQPMKRQAEQMSKMIPKGESQASPKSNLTQPEFQVLLDLMMVSDPWPLQDGRDILVRLLNAESRQRDHASWIDAYHMLTVKKPGFPYGLLTGDSFEYGGFTWHCIDYHAEGTDNRFLDSAAEQVWTASGGGYILESFMDRTRWTMKYCEQDMHVMLYDGENPAAAVGVARENEDKLPR